MLWLLFIVAMSCFVGLVAKAIYNPGNTQGCLPTILIGFAGFYVGGFIKFLLGRGAFMDRSGIFFAIIGAVIVCWLYRQFEAGQIMKVRSMRIEQNEKAPNQD
jgi:uncharacterized membrane protein YeaQ/YmgE (transglycosylase-associated protein family)